MNVLFQPLFLKLKLKHIFRVLLTPSSLNQEHDFCPKISISRRKAAAASHWEHTLVTFCLMTKVLSQNHTNTHTHRERFLRITHRAANHVRNAATITHIAKPPLPAFKVSQDGKMPTWIRRLGVFWFRRASYQPSLHWNCLQKDQLLQRTLFSRRQLTNCFIAQGLTRKYHWSVKILQPY